MEDTEEQEVKPEPVEVKKNNQEEIKDIINL
jgi:hypothetical protein